MGARDFDFLHGQWHVTHRKLRERLAGCTDWLHLTGTAEVQPVLCGIGNIDRLTFDGVEHEGMTLRLFDRDTEFWTIHWADSRKGRLDPPLTGRFENGIGLFFGDDVHDGQVVRVRFIWRSSTENGPQWEQAFSVDGGQIWETNWIMDFARAHPAAD